MLPIKIIDAVCALVAEGATTTQACQKLDISRDKLYQMLRKSDPQTQQKYQFAQETGAEAMADALADIQDEIPNALMARVVSENRRWLLSKRHSARYGDKRQDDDRTADLTAILREAIDRIPRPSLPLSSDYGATIEHQNISESDIFGH